MSVIIRNRTITTSLFLRTSSRLSSTVSSISAEYIQNNYIVHRRGDSNHGSREYLLLSPDSTENQPAAALLAHRNIMFGARSLLSDYSLKDLCLPLVEVAVKDAGINGEQPQAIASLAGLSEWVQACLNGDSESDELSKLREKDQLVFEAVQAIATGIPRQGHSVVGVGTFRDGEEGWKALAKEYVEKGLCEEANLYISRDAKLVGIEHLADKNPDYIKKAGGAMARLFFL